MFFQRETGFCGKDSSVESYLGDDRAPPRERGKRDAALCAEPAKRKEEDSSDPDSDLDSSPDPLPSHEKPSRRRRRVSISIPESFDSKKQDRDHRDFIPYQFRPTWPHKQTAPFFFQGGGSIPNGGSWGANDFSPHPYAFCYYSRSPAGAPRRFGPQRERWEPRRGGDAQQQQPQQIFLYEDDDIVKERFSHVITGAAVVAGVEMEARCWYQASLLKKASNAVASDFAHVHSLQERCRAMSARHAVMPHHGPVLMQTPGVRPPPPHPPAFVMRHYAGPGTKSMKFIPGQYFPSPMRDLMQTVRHQIAARVRRSVAAAKHREAEFVRHHAAELLKLHKAQASLQSAQVSFAHATQAAAQATLAAHCVCPLAAVGFIYGVLSLRSAWKRAASSSEKEELKPPRAEEEEEEPRLPRVTLPEVETPEKKKGAACHFFIGDEPPDKERAPTRRGGVLRWEKQEKEPEGSTGGSLERTL